MRRPRSPSYPPPSRARSRTPNRWRRLEERTQGVLQAHRKNVAKRRGGQAAVRRTRGIHKQILRILIEYLVELISYLAGVRQPIPSELKVRRYQAEEQLNFLENGGVPTRKAEVLPGLREYCRGTSQWKSHLGLEDLSDLESCRTNDTLSCHSSESSEIVETDDNPFGDPVLRAAWERFQSKGPDYVQRVEREAFGISAPPDLPEWFRTGPRLERTATPTPSSAAASSSSTAAPSRPVVSDRAAIQVTKADPLLKAKPKPKPKAQPRTQYTVTYLDPSPETLRRLQLQTWEGSETFIGKQAVISWDHHQVLDTFRHSGRRISRAEGGQYPAETRKVLETAHRLTANLVQVVLSYCHRPETVRSVVQCATQQSELAKIIVSRKPDGPLGKLAALKALFSTSTYLIHVDDSAEVLTEIRDYIRGRNTNWKIIGVTVPRKPIVEGVLYVRNVQEALETILKRTGLARIPVSS